MARHTILLSLCAALSFFVLQSPTQSTAQDQLPPAGTAVQYRDGAGQLQAAVFVEKTAAGLIKVKLPNGTTLSFPPNRVRVAPGAIPDGDAPAAPKPKMAKLRTWTDVTGAFKVEAEFIGMADGKVELKKADGKLISLPLDKLSLADRDIAKFLLAAAPNPFEAEIGDAPPLTSTLTAVWKNVPETRVRYDNIPNTLDYSQEAELPDVPWQGKAEPVTPPPPKYAPNFVNVPKTESLGPMIMDPAHHWAWIYQSNSDYKQLLSIADRVDLVQGKLLPTIRFAQRNRPLAVDPSGKLLATVDDESRINFWTIDEDKLVGLKSLVFTYASLSPDPNATLLVLQDHANWTAEFIDAEHLQVRTREGYINVRVGDLKPIAWIKMYGGVLSPSRKQMAFSHRTGLYLCDTLTGKMLGKFAMTDFLGEPVNRNEVRKRIVFSADGRSLIGVSQAIREFDLTTGQQTKHVSVRSETTAYEDIGLGKGGYVVLGGEYAIDSATGLVMSWLFERDQKRRAFFGGEQWFLTEEDAFKSTFYTLKHAEFPDDALLQLAKSKKLDNFVVVQPGAVVSISFRRAENLDEAKIREALTRQLKVIGATVAPEGVLGTHIMVVQVRGIDGNLQPSLLLANNTLTDFYWRFGLPPIKPGLEPPSWTEIFEKMVAQMPEKIIRMPRGNAVFRSKLTAGGLVHE